MRWIVLAALGVLSCARPAREGQSAAALVADAAPAALTWVDFAADGCSLVGGACRGPAPLTLHMGALAPRAIEGYRWSFGDGTPDSTEENPAHTFDLPGNYTVTLVATAGGSSLQASRAGFVVVTPLALGAPCSTGECGSNLTCICGDGCAGVPGVCSVACSTGCAAGAACVAFASGDADWQRRLCLATCTSDGDCAAGLRCRELLSTTGWVKACFGGGFPADEGGSCAGDDATCAGGHCEALGARGLCAASCDATHPCPSYASCAALSNGKSRCLVACSDARPCIADPFLACQAPDPSGALGFTVAGGSGSYCAPRRCTEPSDCGTDGDCQSGFCNLR